MMANKPAIDEILAQRPEARPRIYVSSDLPGGAVDRALALTHRNSFATGAGRPHNAPATRWP
jgi:hypothetical protein